jgi:hypothetical protein
MRRRIADRLRLKSTPSLAFEVDRVFEQEAHIDELLRQVGRDASKDAGKDVGEDASEDAGEDVNQKKPD